MKIAITGHTSGVGKSLYDKLVGLGHTVFGYSRANGFDLSNKDQVAKLVKKIVYRENINYTKGGFEYEDDDVDVFINNAYYNWSQVDLLYKV